MSKAKFTHYSFLYSYTWNGSFSGRVPSGFGGSRWPTGPAENALLYVTEGQIRGIPGIVNMKIMDAADGAHESLRRKIFHFYTFPFEVFYCYLMFLKRKVPFSSLRLRESGKSLKLRPCWYTRGGTRNSGWPVWYFFVPVRRNWYFLKAFGTSLVFGTFLVFWYFWYFLTKNWISPLFLRYFVTQSNSYPKLCFSHRQNKMALQQTWL